MFIRFFVGMLLLIVAMLYLSSLNPETIQFHLAPGVTFPIYTSLLILSSMGVGAFLVMIGVAVRDTRRGVMIWREKGRLKKKEKIMDLYRQGVNDLLSKKRDEALKSFKKILEWEPGNVDVLLRIGEAYRYNGNFKEAIRFHRQARNAAPQQLAVLFALAKDYRRSDQLPEAAEIYRSILKVDEKNLSAFLKLRGLYEKQEAWDKAYELQKAYWALKKDGEERQRLHYYQLMTAKRFDPEEQGDKLIKLYTDLIKADKSFAAPYLELGRLKRKRGDDEEAVKIWKKGFRETGDAVFLDVLDDFYLKREDPAEIIKIYKQAISRFPDRPVFRFLLGKIYYRLEMIDDALEIFEGLSQQGIQFPLLRQVLGDIYYRRGRVEEAVEEFKHSVDFVRPIHTPYSCETCGYEQEEWAPRCGECGQIKGLSIHLPRNESTSVAAVPVPGARHA
jgi:lipopolysaccharide biosynthesis regulator YciM